MGQRNLLAQKMRQILGAASWQVAMNGRMQTDAGKAHIQLRTCYSFLDQSFSLLLPGVIFRVFFSFGSTSQRVRYWGLKGFGSLLD